jgi:hypothetical protein
MFLAKESLHFMMELENNLPHVMWAGMTAACMSVSVVDLLTLHLNSEMLGVQFIPQHRQKTLGRCVAALTVHDILNEHFPDFWNGCGSPTCPVPLSWPPHNFDPTIMDSCLWGISKGQVAVQCCQQLVAQSCGTAIYHLYHRYVSIFHTEHCSTTGGVFGTWCTYRNTPCAVALTNAVLK